MGPDDSRLVALALPGRRRPPAMKRLCGLAIPVALAAAAVAFWLEHPSQAAGWILLAVICGWMEERKT